MEKMEKDDREKGNKPKRDVPKKSFDLVKSFAKYTKKPTKSPNGNKTIGYGHKGLNVPPVLSKLGAEKLLRADMDDAAISVEKLVTVELTDDQYSTLISFAFQYGYGALKRSDFLILVNEGKYIEAVSLKNGTL